MRDFITVFKVWETLKWKSLKAEAYNGVCETGFSGVAAGCV